MVTGLPECRTRMRIGELGSQSPIATKLRSLSKITARSPTAPRWLMEVIDSLKTHGWPARIWRRASGVTRTAIRLSPTTGSWSNTDMSSGDAMCCGTPCPNCHLELVRSGHDGSAGRDDQSVGVAAGESHATDVRGHRQPARRSVPAGARGHARGVRT